jgi:tRNA nucleotidyltransferase (CCA-adding enzyme)
VLHDPYSGKADLEAGIIRVLHELSFVDDPTRILRAIRYEARLGARLDPLTEELAKEAIESGALRTVSGARLRNELMALFREPNMPEAVRRLCELRLDRALYPCLICDPDRAASAALGAAEVGADRALAVLSAMIAPDADALHPWLDRMGFPRNERYRVARAAYSGPHLAHTLRPDMSGSELYDLLHLEPLEALAVALAWRAPGDAVLRYLTEIRGVGLEVTGSDLIDAGVPESPALGRALEETLRRKLDGKVAGRDDELSTAVEIAKSEVR